MVMLLVVSPSSESEQRAVHDYATQMGHIEAVARLESDAGMMTNAVLGVSVGGCPCAAAPVGEVAHAGVVVVVVGEVEAVVEVDLRADVAAAAFSVVLGVSQHQLGFPLS